MIKHTNQQTDKHQNRDNYFIYIIYILYKDVRLEYDDYE